MRIDEGQQARPFDRNLPPQSQKNLVASRCRTYTDGASGVFDFWKALPCGIHRLGGSQVTAKKKGGRRWEKCPDHGLSRRPDLIGPRHGEYFGRAVPALLKYKEMRIGIGRHLEAFRIAEIDDRLKLAKGRKGFAHGAAIDVTRPRSGA